MHVPFTHSSPVAHEFPHAPQFAPSAYGSMHAAPQSMRPVAHCGVPAKPPTPVIRPVVPVATLLAPPPVVVGMVLVVVPVPAVVPAPPEPLDVAGLSFSEGAVAESLHAGAAKATAEKPRR